MDDMPLHAADEWGPFGAPLFDDPSARALSRVGVIDIGSNSVRMVVFDGAARSPAYFFNEKVMAGLGRGLAETGRLNPEGRVRALSALGRFAILAEAMAVSPLSVVATAAVREAIDGPEFAAEVAERTGLRMTVIGGDEEARLAAQGVLLGWPDAEGIVCDLGGNSMELARTTTPLGPFRLHETGTTPAARATRIAATLRPVAQDLAAPGSRLYLVGGSWRVIGRLDMERRGYPLTVLHEYRMTPAQVLETIDWLGQSDLAALRARTSTSSERMALVPQACEVLAGLLAEFRPREIDISAYGIREGMLYDQMPEQLRRRDPLIEAARMAEASQARMPGFGRKLHAFLAPLFRHEPPARQRLIKAACLLHDTTWRAHPDYRAEVCFDNATRANLGGLDHPGRVFLGLALLHRYKNSRSGSRFEPLLRLLDEDQIRDAEILGKAMRFGAMFSVAEPETAGELRVARDRKRVELHLTPKGRTLFGEVSEARFRALAQAMKAEPVVLDRG
jgi:exopolyphosphatase/guanosine-5'-triphosphate,3'-diphosphate pyrophosphatase